jgi:rubredoxin
MNDSNLNGNNYFGQVFLERAGGNMKASTLETTRYRCLVCAICGWIYNEKEGAPDEGIPAGTRWEDIPADWICPDCGTGKDDFAMSEL